MLHCVFMQTRTGRQSSLSGRSGNSSGGVCIATPVPGTARPSEWRCKWNMHPLRPLSFSKQLLIPRLTEAETVNWLQTYGTRKEKRNQDTKQASHRCLLFLYNQTPHDLWMLAHCTMPSVWLGDMRILNPSFDTRWGLQVFRVLRRKKNRHLWYSMFCVCTVGQTCLIR